jgi:hypothetical protein
VSWLDADLAGDEVPILAAVPASSMTWVAASTTTVATVVVATSSSAPTMISTAAWSSTTTLSSVGGEVAPTADGAIGEKLDAIVVGGDLRV